MRLSYKFHPVEFFQVIGLNSMYLLNPHNVKINEHSPHVDLDMQLKELKRQKSRRLDLEEEGMKAYERFMDYKNKH